MDGTTTRGAGTTAHGGTIDKSNATNVLATGGKDQNPIAQHNQSYAYEIRDI